MKTRFILTLFFTILSNCLIADDSVCILNHERRIHPYSETLDKIAGSKKVKIVNEATPNDFLDCIKEGHTEITIIAHAFQIDKEGTKYKIGYFKEMPKERRNKEIDYAIDFYTKELISLETHYSKTCNNSNGLNYELSKCSSQKTKINKIKKKIEEYKTVEDSFPLYDKKIYFNRIFKVANKVIKEKKNQGNNHIKHLRFIGCVPEEVFKGHPSLKALIKDNGISLKTAPKQNLMSLIKKKDVTVLDKTWLYESLQFEDKENDGFYVYLKQKTLVASKKGETIALRGKYKIETKGIALGLSSKWTSIYLKYDDVKDLEVGETKEINVPQLDLSASFWANGEIQIGRKFRLLGTSEVNSLGISLGLFQKIKITRNY